MTEQITENISEALKKKYKQKGAQQLTLAEYLANKKKAKKRKGQIPTHIKIILATPFLIIFCFGIFFIPYMLYLIATSPLAPENPDKNETKTENPSRISP